MDRVVQIAEPDEGRKCRHTDCGNQSFIWKDSERAKYKLIGNFCGYRTCPRCWKRYKFETSTRIRHWMGNVKENEWRFVTLTIRSMDGPLKDQLTFLQECFRRLRQTNIWKESQTYGKAVIEVTWNPRRRQWHPHLHAISKGRWIDQDDLRRVWRKCTGGSHGALVTLIKNDKHIVAEITKYLGKIPKLGDVGNRLDLQVDYYKATRNRKMVIRYGRNSPKMPSFKECRDIDKTDWIPVGPLAQTLKKAAAGDADAIAILKAMDDDEITDESNLPPPGAQ